MQCLRDLHGYPQPIARGSAKKAHTFQSVANGVGIDNPISPKPLCPTRWTVRFVAINAALQSYPIIVPFLSEVAVRRRLVVYAVSDGQMMLALIAAHRVFGVTNGLYIEPFTAVVNSYHMRLYGLWNMYNTLLFNCECEDPTSYS